MAEATYHQKRVRRAMEGNLAAWFHPFENKIAFCYPNGNINIYDSGSWKKLSSISVCPSSTVNERIVELASARMGVEGFDREGRLLDEM